MLVNFVSHTHTHTNLYQVVENNASASEDERKSREQHNSQRLLCQYVGVGE